MGNLENNPILFMEITFSFLCFSLTNASIFLLFTDTCQPHNTDVPLVHYFPIAIL